MQNQSALYERAARQHGLVTRNDLDQLGFSRARRRTMQADGRLELLGRQTYRVGGAPHTPHQRVMAACLDTGGVASHLTSPALLGIPGFGLPTHPDVMVRRSSYSYDQELARVHTTTWLADEHVVDIEGIPCLNVARTLFTLAGMVPEITLERARGAVDGAVAAHMASDRWLWWMLEKLRCRGRNGVAVFEEILSGRAAGQVTESWLEREFLAVLEAGGVPLPACQHRIRARGAFVARVDFAYEARRVIIEVSGHAWHHTRAQRTADARRRRKLVLMGYVVLEFTYEDVVERPDEVIAEVLAAIGLRRAG